MARHFPRVLFFINGMNPSDDEKQEANDYGPGVVFRNAQFVSNDGPIEDADAVAGMVPDRYAEALPNIKEREAVAARMSGDPQAGMTDEQRKAAAANDLARGNRGVTKNAALAERKFVADRRNQANPSNLGSATGSDNPARVNTALVGTTQPAGAWKTGEANKGA